MKYFNKRKLTYIFLILSTLIINTIFCQSEVINIYIAQALENNLALKQKDFELNQSILELNEARGLFFPSVNIFARYSRAGGGRVIDFPIGDIINPIHQGLNFLNPLFGYPANLPNISIPFLRKEEHETKLNILQPIIQPALFYNYSIKSNLVDIKNLEKDVFKRNIISEVKIAYFNYQKLLKIQELLTSSLVLIEENLRISESLFNNDKITIDAVYSANSELLDLKQKIIKNENDLRLSKNYFNFLLNRSEDSVIETQFTDSIQLPIYTLYDFENSALEKREELLMLNISKEIAQDKIGADLSKYFPGLSLSFDYGFQGEKYKFSNKDDFWMASLVLNWNLFSGFQDQMKIENAKLEKDKIEVNLNELKKQIKLQVREKFNNVISAIEFIKISKQKLLASQKTYNIVKKKYSEGLISQIDFFDAQNKFIQADVERIISFFNYYIELAELEKVSASYKLK